MWRSSDILELNEMVGLGQSYYQEGEMTDSAFLNWQYFNRANGDVIGFVARNEENKLVGQYLVAPIMLRIKGKLLPASYSFNTLTHPDYNGKGIFGTLARLTYDKCREQGIILTYGFPNRNSYPGFIKKLDFADMGHLQFYIKPFNIPRLLQTKISNKYAALLIGSLAAPVKLFFHGRSKMESTGIEIAEVLHFNENYHDFWLKNSGKYKVMVDRSQGYMNWRYFNVPQRTYRVFMALNKGLVEGFIVLRLVEIKGIQTGLIVDFMTSHSVIGNECGTMLVKKALDVFQDEKADMAGCLLTKHAWETENLRKTGFRLCPQFLLPQSPVLILKIHNLREGTTRELLYDLKNWFLTMGDYDVG